jgi:hypothetical protein
VPERVSPQLQFQLPSQCPLKRGLKPRCQQASQKSICLNLGPPHIWSYITGGLSSGTKPRVSSAHPSSTSGGGAAQLPANPGLSCFGAMQGQGMGGGGGGGGGGFGGSGSKGGVQRGAGQAAAAAGLVSMYPMVQVRVCVWVGGCLSSQCKYGTVA